MNKNIYYVGKWRHKHANVTDREGTLNICNTGITSTEDVQNMNKTL